MLEIDIKQENVLKDYLKSLESDKLIADLVSREPHKLDTKKLGEEYSSQVVKQLLISIAEDEGLSKKLNDFLENEKKETM